MLVKEQIKKAPLSECPTFSEKELENVQYIATAKVIKSKKCGQVLVVDYYSSKDNKLQVRFFSDKKNYISYVVDEDKWTNRAIYNLIQGECLSIAKHQQIAKDFFNIPENKNHFWIWINYKRIDGIFGYCSYFVQQKMQEKSRKAQEKKEYKQYSHLCMFPERYGNELNEFCDSKVFPNAYIFFSKLDNRYKREGICTHCKEHFEVPNNIKHGQTGQCPICQHEVIYYASWYRSQVQEKSTICYPLKKDNQLLIDFISVTRTCYSDGIKSHYYLPVAKTLYLNENGSQKIYSYGWQKIPYYGYRWCDWGKTPVYREAFTYPEKLDEAFGNKYYNVNLKTIALQEKHSFDFIALLDNLKNNPYCEYLCKMGLTKLASQVEYGDCNTGTSFGEVLGVTAQYIPLYKEMGISIQEHRAIKSTNCYVNAEWVKQYRQIKKEIKYGVDICEILEKMTLNRFWKYVTKQKEIHPGISSYQVATWFRDYIRMNEELGVVLNKKNMFPADIKQAHDIVSQRLNEIREVEAKVASEVALQFVNSFFKGYEKDGLTVLMPTSRQDFIREGQELSHCVGQGRYYKNHIAGERMIFFIRKANAPKTAYYTAEIDMVTFGVLQLYGYGDRLPNAEVRKFTREFAQYLKNETKKLRKAS